MNSVMQQSHMEDATGINNLRNTELWMDEQRNAVFPYGRCNNLRDTQYNN